jgi:hypothetical protein
MISSMQGWAGEPKLSVHISTPFIFRISSLIIPFLQPLFLRSSVASVKPRMRNIIYKGIQPRDRATIRHDISRQDEISRRLTSMANALLIVFTWNYEASAQAP